MKRPSSIAIVLFLLYGGAHALSGFFNIAYGSDRVVLRKVEGLARSVGIPGEEFTYWRGDPNAQSASGTPEPSETPGSPQCSIACENEAGVETLSFTCAQGFVAVCECVTGNALARGECIPEEE